MLLVADNYSWLGAPARLILEMLAAVGMLAGVEACVLIQKISASSSRNVDAAMLTQVRLPAQCIQSIKATDSLSRAWHTLEELS